MATPITANRDEGAAVTHLSVKSDRCYKGLHYIEGAPFRISFWTIATNIDPVEGVRRLRFADDLAAAWNTRQQAEAACKAREDALVEAGCIKVGDIQAAWDRVDELPPIIFTEEEERELIAELRRISLARARTATDEGGM